MEKTNCNIENGELNLSFLKWLEICVNENEEGICYKIKKIKNWEIKLKGGKSKNISFLEFLELFYQDKIEIKNKKNSNFLQLLFPKNKFYKIKN